MGNETFRFVTLNIFQCKKAKETVVPVGGPLNPHDILF